MQQYLTPLLGGVLIGASVSIMLMMNGRVTGISGIINGIFSSSKSELFWRFQFVAGLFLGGLTLSVLNPKVFDGALDTPIWTVVVAGLLVGFGTIMGSGCTSGHGVCGISRLSMRSIVATLSFMIAGVLAVYAFRSLGVLP